MVNFFVLWSYDSLLDTRALPSEVTRLKSALNN